MLLTIENIAGVVTCNSNMLTKSDISILFVNDNHYRLVFRELDIKKIPDMVKNFIVLYGAKQPCNVSVYACDVTNVEHLGMAIGKLISLTS
jgi:hypothetical protein